MALFRVRFMNQFPNNTGHDHPVCQREIEVITSSIWSTRHFRRRSASSSDTRPSVIGGCGRATSNAGNCPCRLTRQKLWQALSRC